jgi:hypothetical protein
VEKPPAARSSKIRASTLIRLMLFVTALLLFAYWVPAARIFMLVAIIGGGLLGLLMYHLSNR